MHPEETVHGTITQLEQVNLDSYKMVEITEAQLGLQ